MPSDFIVSADGNNLATITLDDDLKNFKVTGSVASEIDQFLRSKQIFNIGGSSQADGEMIVNEVPTSNPALMQRALMILPAIFRSYGQIRVDGPWNLFTDRQ